MYCSIHLLFLLDVWYSTHTIVNLEFRNPREMGDVVLVQIDRVLSSPDFAEWRLFGDGRVRAARRIGHTRSSLQALFVTRFPDVWATGIARPGGCCNQPVAISRYS